MDGLNGNERRDKRARTSSCDDDTLPRYLVIKKTSGDFSKANPFLISKAIKGLVGDVKTVRKIRDGILVETSKPSQSEILLKVKLFCESDVTVSPHLSLNSCKGVISCKDLLNCTEDDIKYELKSQGVVDVRRITTRRSGTVENTPSVVLTFNLCELPKFVYAAMYRLPVRPYIPNPLRCFNCQKFNHSSANCKSPKLCICGKPPHEGSPCESPTCVNCTGTHASSSRDCPEFKKEYAVLEYKTLNKCSFPEARQYVSRNSPTLTKSFASVAAKPVSPSININDIASALIPQIKLIVENMFTQFVNTFMSQFSQTAFKIPTISVTKQSNTSNLINSNPRTSVSTARTSNIVPPKSSPTTTASAIIPTYGTQLPTTMNPSQTDITDDSDGSQTSLQGDPSNPDFRRKDRRGWPKGKARK